MRMKVKLFNRIDHKGDDGEIRSVQLSFTHPNIQHCGHFRTPRAAWREIVRSLT